MSVETVEAELVVVGAGLAGVCAAVQAARLGLSVCLVGDRPVLGGNSSSELRMWTRGATGGGNLYAEETGILGELKLENLYRNPEGNVVLWDEVLLDAVLAEPAIGLYLNCHATGARTRAAGQGRRILAVEGFQLASERRFEWRGGLFLDATGDGTIGALAGAECRRGREGRDEFGESLAPERPDGYSLGSSIYFQSRSAERPVRFVKPAFAYGLEQVERLLGRGGRLVNETMSGTDFWWLEYGGELDTIGDNQAIALELRRLVYGVWNYIKNSGRFPAADRLTLEWVGLYPCKRESRRLLGDYLLTQADLESGRSFEDAVCHGGWFLDDHPPAGIYSPDPFCLQLPVPAYGIPLRCLYSRNVENLLMAGRDISVTHAAFASSRIMNTCALTGQAAGAAAAVGLRRGLDPRGVARERPEELRQLLLRHDLFIPGCRNEDPADLARGARAAISSLRAPAAELSSGAAALERDCWLLFPPLTPDAGLELLVDCSEQTELRLESWSCGRAAGLRPGRRLGESRLAVGPGNARWLRLPAAPAQAEPFYWVLKAAPGLELRLSRESFTGVLGRWDSGPDRFTPCFRLAGEGAGRTAQDLWGAAALFDGLDRPCGRPSLWMSAPLSADGERLELAWPRPVELAELRLCFNPDLSKELTNLHAEKPAAHHGYRARVGMPPELVRSYSIEARLAGRAPRVLAEAADNRKRLAVHRFDPVELESLIVRIHATWGGRHAELFQVRAYGREAGR